MSYKGNSTVEEKDSDSDYGIGSLSPIQCSSPGSRSWYAYAWSEITVGQVEHPISFNSPIPVSTFGNISSYFDAACLEIVDADYRILHPQDCLQNPASLRMLEERDCPNLAYLCEVPDSLQNLSSLRMLKIQDCRILHDLLQLPNCFQNLITLRLLEIQDYRIVQDCLQNLSSLIIFAIRDCFQNLSSLRMFTILVCLSLPGLRQLPVCLGNLPSLRKLSLSSHGLPELPNQRLCRQDLPSLRTSNTRVFRLLEFLNQRLSSLSPLGTWKIPTSLQAIFVTDCDIPKPTALQAVKYCLGYYPASERIHSHEQSRLSPYLDSTAVQGSSNSQKMLHSSQRFECRRNARCENQEVIIDTQTTNPSTRKRLSTTWNAAGEISLEDLEQNYGKNREEAAESLQVSVSTFKRICRKHGILRWPSSKRKKGKCFLSAQKCNASVQVADGGHASTSQSPNAFSTALQSFSTSSCVIEALEESSLRSTLSKHKEASMSLNHSMLGTGETTKGNNILQERASAGQGVAYKSQQHKPRNGSISFKSSMLGAQEKGSQPPQNGMLCEEDIETSSISRKKRKRLEKEAHYMDPMTHFEGKLPEILNYTSKRQAADGTSKGPSCLSSISWTSGGFNKDSNLSSLSITGHVVDDMDSTRMGVQPFVGSMSMYLLSSLSCNGNTVQRVKLLFNNLIVLPLKDLTDPENEASMKETLSILADNLSLFSEEQAKRIVELKLEFTSLVHSWREHSRSQMHSQKFFADLEKTKNMVATSAKDEECLKIRSEELQSKKEELMAQLEVVQKEQDGVAEQRRENFKQTKHLVSLAEEKASRTKEKHLVMTITSAKLNNLVDQWAAIQSPFMQTG